MGLIKNRLKQEWSSGHATLNGWLSINSAFTAEIMANQGYDLKLFKVEQKTINVQSLVLPTIDSDQLTKVNLVQ